MATQAKLLGVLPTPAVARANLRMARKQAKEAADVVDGLKDRVSAASDEMKAAAAEVEEAEADLLEADEGSKEDTAAAAAHDKGLKRGHRASTDWEKVKAALKLARTEAKQAGKRLVAAREDLEAIREGRRK
jgi:hypothetical protein